MLGPHWLSGDHSSPPRRKGLNQHGRSDRRRMAEAICLTSVGRNEASNGCRLGRRAKLVSGNSQGQIKAPRLDFSHEPFDCQSGGLFRGMTRSSPRRQLPANANHTGCRPVSPASRHGQWYTSDHFPVNSRALLTIHGENKHAPRIPETREASASRRSGAGERPWRVGPRWNNTRCRTIHHG